MGKPEPERGLARLHLFTSPNLTERKVVDKATLMKLCGQRLDALLRKGRPHTVHVAEVADVLLGRREYASCSWD